MTEVTGRLAAWVMNDLRVKVFTHLQRLSLDFYTEEKAGVIMSRMTSDIENLQQLLQDGLAQFAVQGLTMIVITCIMFATERRAGPDHHCCWSSRRLTIVSLWFRRASERGYDRVRDGIASVLADLSESLHGVRIVTAHNRQRHNVVHHRNVVGAYRDANLYTAQINAIYGPGTQMLGYLAQAALLAIGGVMVVLTRLSDRRPWWPSSCISTASCCRSSCWCSSTTSTSRGSRRSSSCAACFAIPPNVPEDRRCRSSCRRFRATSSSTT